MSTGVFNTTNFTNNLAKKSFASMITRLMPNGQAPLFALTSYLKTETAVNTTHGFFTKTMVFPEFTINKDGGYLTTSTGFAIDATDKLLPGMILVNDRSGENIIINSVNSTTSISVTRDVGTTGPKAINDNDVFYQVGNAFEEGSQRPDANNIIPVEVNNLTQIFRNTWAITGTAEQVEVIAGNKTEAENRQDCAGFHAADIEKALFFGQKSSGTRNGKPFRTMDGLLNIVENPAYYPASYGGSVNSFTAGATTNWTQLLAMLDNVFDQATDPKSSNERLLFVGGAAKLVLNEIGRLNGTYQLMDGQTNFGLRFDTLKTPRGTFRIIEHPLFNSNASWAKLAVGVDLATFNLAYLGNRKTQSKEYNTQGKVASDYGVDAIGGTLTTECTCTVKNPPANVVIRNLTAAAQG
ncbi:MAG: hypothetical protein CMK07_13540 [Ponticaulis sp.]|nr:hypothetical protein [Ponticaulis sp.]|tara:strand:+ start:5959 stop:7188 length:1230 start_codon:yes stop_codon:yes gene_type:complete